jgi:hypothetical protein
MASGSTVDLETNLSQNQPLQKALSHFGALRLQEELLAKTVVAEQLEDLEIWEAMVSGDRYYLATDDPTNQEYSAWLYNVANGLKMPFTNCERLGDMVEAGLGLLYLASMYPSSFVTIIPDPNRMWRKIETSIASRVTWTCPIKFGTSPRKRVDPLITLPSEMDDILRIQSELEYEPLIRDHFRVERISPSHISENGVVDLQIQVPVQVGKNCQFCESGTSTLQCNCEVGALLCAVWQASTEPRSQFPWEKLRRLINDAEQSLTKRQRTEPVAA